MRRSGSKGAPILNVAHSPPILCFNGCVVKYCHRLLETPTQRRRRVGWESKLKRDAVEASTAALAEQRASRFNERAKEQKKEREDEARLHARNEHFGPSVSGERPV